MELTGDKVSSLLAVSLCITFCQDVFVYLHKYFVFLLKTGGKRLTECIVEGPPQVRELKERV